jgi:hypothetical protein
MSSNDGWAGSVCFTEDNFGRVKDDEWWSHVVLSDEARKAEEEKGKNEEESV